MPRLEYLLENDEVRVHIVLNLLEEFPSVRQVVVPALKELHPEEFA